MRELWNERDGGGTGKVMRGYYQSQGCTKQLWEVSIRNGERFAEHGYQRLSKSGLYKTVVGGKYKKWRAVC